VGAVIELKRSGEMWQVTYDASVIACALSRESAIKATAALLRGQLNDPATVEALTFVGVELTELLNAPPMIWKSKAPQVDVDLFGQAEAYLQMELIPTDQAQLVTDYQAALQDEDFDRALECLVEMGEQQNCSNPFWGILERLAEVVWPTQWMVDRRAKGQVEARIAAIRQRARGRDAPLSTPDRRGRKQYRDR
jgi:hypothetical protein